MESNKKPNNTILGPQIDPNQELTLAVDSSGIKVSNRGEWLRDKWKMRKGFIKIHLAVDTQSGQIISLEITDEKVGDNKKLKPLIRKAKQKVSIAKVLGDGAYDSKASFRYLATQNIEPVIKVRKNSSFHSRGCFERKKMVVFQQDSNWKAQFGYGQRWKVETAFSCLKRCFGEYICATKWANMVNELILKANLYNFFMNLNRQ